MRVRTAIRGAWMALALVATAHAQEPTQPSATPAPEGAPAAAETPAPAVAEDADAAAEGEWRRELATTEQRVHQLKEQVFRSKATLQLLRELAVQGASGGGGLRVTHNTELSRSYRLSAVDYYLDGRNIFSWTLTEGGEALPRSVEVRDQPIAPGQHSLQVSCVLRGEGGGVFEYVDDYQTKVDSSHSFDVQGGLLTDLVVKLTTKGSGRKKFTERPSLVYEERRETLKAE